MGREKERLLVLLLFLGLVLGSESARTHERFSQSTYYANPNSLRPEDSKYVSPGKNEDTIPGKESKEESKSDIFPAKVEQTGETSPGQKPEPYTSGDFTADARPWWVNPQYQNYGNSPLGKPSTDKYPSTLDPRYFTNYQRSGGSSREYGTQWPGRYDQYPQTDNVHDTSYAQSDEGCPTEYWISNTQMWPAFLNTKSTIGDAFGTPAVQIFGRATILQALVDTHDDGYHTLARNGCTALLNSYTRQQYKFSHQKVIESFNAALVSNKAAARQAALFDEANISALGANYNSCF